MYTHKSIWYHLDGRCDFLERWETLRYVSVRVFGLFVKRPEDDTPCEATYRSLKSIAVYRCVPIVFNWNLILMYTPEDENGT